MVYNYSEALFNRIPRIVGVEAWKPYGNPLWNIYDEMHNEMLESFVTHHKFELIVMMDVIEHLELKEGHKQLKRLQAMLSPGGVMIVSTPAIFVEQGAYAGNPFEEHKSLWTGEKFKKLGFKELRPEKNSLFGERMLIYKFKQEEKK